MSITITHLHGVDNWQMAVASGDVTEGTAYDILRAIAERMGCKLNITEQRVRTVPTERAIANWEQQSHEERVALIASRNADGRHPIG